MTNLHMLSMKKLRDAGVSEMARYDIVFVGHAATGNIVPFKKAAYTETGGAAAFTAMAAARCMKRVALVTRLAKGDEHILESFKAVGIDTYVQTAEMHCSLLQLWHLSQLMHNHQFFIISFKESDSSGLQLE